MGETTSKLFIYLFIYLKRGYGSIKEQTGQTTKINWHETKYLVDDDDDDDDDDTRITWGRLQTYISHTYPEIVQLLDLELGSW